MKEQILTYLSPACPFRDTLKWYKTVESTNTLAKRLAADGAPHGTVLIADSQTGGRGRMGRNFHSPAGCGIYFSLILRPDCRAEQLMHLTCAAGVAACDAIEKVTGLRPGTKWINDLVFEGKKLGGILTELSLSPAEGGVQYAVIGIGINCNHKRSDFPPELQEIATSLAAVTKSTCDRARLCAALTEALCKMSNGLISNKTDIMTRYRKDCITIGKQVIILRADGKCYATALSVDDDGGLLVAYEDGTTEIVNSGEVSVRGMYGYV